MPLLLEHRDRGPLPGEKRYEWLARAIESLTTHPDVPARAMIPTEKQLGAAFGLSRQTVQRAMSRLVNDGLINRVAGRGTFLTPDEHAADEFVATANLLASPLNAWHEMTSPLHTVVDVAAAGRLHLADDYVVRVSFRRLNGNRPYAFTTVSMPLEVGELLSDARELAFPHVGPGMTTVAEVLDGLLPGGLAGAERSVTASPLSADAASALKREEGESSVHVDTVFSDVEDRLVALQSSSYLPGMYSDRLTFSRARRPPRRSAT